MNTGSHASDEAKLAQLVDKCLSEGPVIIEREGKPVALLIAAPADEDELEKLILQHCPRFWEMLERSKEDIKNGRVLSHDQLWQMVNEKSGPEATTPKPQREKRIGAK